MFVFQDPEEMFILEAQVNQMLPLIDSELERVDRHHAKLTQLSTSLVEAINMYHMLMRESDIQSQFPPHMLRHPGPILPNGMYNPQFYAQMGMCFFCFFFLLFKLFIYSFHRLITD